ncbi:MAG: amidohydrolase family protein [Aliidongia sp.]
MVARHGAAKHKAPAHAVDCHHHIYDHRWPVDPHSTVRQEDATVADYRLLQKRIGTTRNVVIQPSAYGVDNTGLIEVLGQFGTKTTRGVAVVNTEVTDAELDHLHTAGVRGIRFNLASPGGATSVEMIEPLSKRIAPRGWHIQMNMTADQIADNAALWHSIPCPSVFDHLGHLPQPEGTKHRAFAVITDLLKQGKGLGQAQRPLYRFDARAALCRYRCDRPGPIWPRHRASWSGAATGRIRLRNPTTSRTTRCCSISSCSRRMSLPCRNVFS